jgi:flagella basal body P-ring formation protein FlgA
MRFRRILKSMILLPVLAVLAAGSGMSHASGLGNAVVPTQIIYPGEIIEPAKIELVEVTNPDLASGYARDVNEVAGLVTTRTLLPGRTITVAHLRPPFAVKRGTSVMLVYDHGGLRITAMGTPLQDAAVGDMIKVRNTDSGLIISGTVMGDGSVLVANK